LDPAPAVLSGAGAHARWPARRAGVRPGPSARRQSGRRPVRGRPQRGRPVLTLLRQRPVPGRLRLLRPPRRPPRRPIPAAQPSSWRLTPRIPRVTIRNPGRPPATVLLLLLGGSPRGPRTRIVTLVVPVWPACDV